MYQSIYNEMVADTTDAIRLNERRAFDRSIELLVAANGKEHGTRESIEALLFTNRLWSILLEDLADDGNGLPDSLKANLISIGIWVLRRTEEIRLGTSRDYTALIEVSESIRKGLEKR
jgi:flagellar biosynthesis activator protein FlaF